MTKAKKPPHHASMLVLVIPVFMILCPSVFSAEPPDVLFSVNFYPNPEQNDEAYVNSFVRIPEKFMELHECTEAFVDNSRGNPAKVSSCKPIARQLFKECQDTIWAILQQRPDEVEELRRGIAVMHDGEKGLAFLYTEFSDGGSGGSWYRWNLYVLRSENGGRLQCPSNPFLGGTHITPGGTTWLIGCKKGESNDQCGDRRLYPSKNAFEMLFTPKGTVMRKVPPNTPFAGPYSYKNHYKYVR